MASPGNNSSSYGDGRSPSARSGGSRYWRREFSELVNHLADDVVFRSQMMAASHNPLASDSAGSHISGLAHHVPTDPSVYASPVYRPPMQQDLRAVHPHLMQDPHAMYSAPVPLAGSPGSPAIAHHAAADSVPARWRTTGGSTVLPTHTIRAVYADAYESLRLGHAAAVLEEMLHSRPGLARQCDSNGVTLLHWACYYRSEPGVLEALLRVNPDAARRASQNDGCLPIHVAASWGCSVTIIALLFSAFPEAVSAADIWGNLPADKALQMGHSDIVPLLSPVERADGQPIVHRPGLFRRVMRDDLEDPRIEVSGSAEGSSRGRDVGGGRRRVEERLPGETGPGESVSWRQRDTRPSTAPAARGGSGRDGRGASHRANDRRVADSEEVRHELAVQRSNLSHRLAKLEHSDSISAAERVSLQGALAAEKRRADKLQRQMERMVSHREYDGGRGGENGRMMRSPDQSLVEAFELSQSIDDERDRSWSMERKLGEMALISGSGSGSGSGGANRSGRSRGHGTQRYGRGTVPFESGR